MIALIAESKKDSEIAKAFYTNYFNPRREEVKMILKRAINEGKCRTQLI